MNWSKQEYQVALIVCLILLFISISGGRQLESISGLVIISILLVVISLRAVYLEIKTNVQKDRIEELEKQINELK